MALSLQQRPSAQQQGREVAEHQPKDAQEWPTPAWWRPAAEMLLREHLQIARFVLQALDMAAHALEASARGVTVPLPPPWQLKRSTEGVLSSDVHYHSAALARCGRGSQPTRNVCANSRANGSSGSSTVPVQPCLHLHMSQLGDNTLEDRDDPTVVASGSKFPAVAAGSTASHTLFLPW